MAPANPILSKNKKIILQNCPTGFFLIYYFLLLEKKINKQTYINNENQEAFIVVIINYKLQVFLLRLLYKMLFIKKNTYRKNQITFLFC